MKKYNLKNEYNFAKITFQNYEQFNNLFDKTLPLSLSSKNFLTIEIKSPLLEIRKTECGLKFSDSQKLALLLNSSLISEASIAGAQIIIDSPWYPFEYDFIGGKDTATAETLFESIFNNAAFEVLYLKLICKYTEKDHRSAVNLTAKESECLGRFLMSKKTKIKNVFLEFEGREGALGISEYACLEVVYGLLKSEVTNLIFKIKGNKGNSFLRRINLEVEMNFNLLKRTKKFAYLKMGFD